VVLVFAKTLLYISYKFNIFIDNLFTNIKLFGQLRKLGIKTCGTAQNNVVALVFKSTHETWKPQWGTLWAREYKGKDNPGVLIALW
jgi:hypothetical protein